MFLQVKVWPFEKLTSFYNLASSSAEEEGTEGGVGVISTLAWNLEQ